MGCEQVLGASKFVVLQFEMVYATLVMNRKTVETIVTIALELWEVKWLVLIIMTSWIEEKCHHRGHQPKV